ncbi:unnamed protein product [Nippostrongylus brasiliensis]|uniref:Kidney androgen-regulated protein-like n=1 Tax=Nippostrongylus brasiliensis TaxID=27835 RepID=A0A0N4YPC6_NIPBR|nr:hypothetical protein Q1695_015766 [Nippostrongylus brasiliensis]VDL82827.1 unnamed protein product [Nippostrongylus brasiliensis]
MVPLLLLLCLFAIHETSSMAVPNTVGDGPSTGATIDSPTKAIIDQIMSDFKVSIQDFIQALVVRTIELYKDEGSGSGMEPSGSTEGSGAGSPTPPILP